MQKILVVGAGIIGVSTAIWLQRAGYHVTLVDREAPAAGTSYGNAGILASGAVIPVTTPGIIHKAPGMVLNNKSPLFLRYRYLPKALPFLTRFLSYANQEHLEYFAQAMTALLSDSVQQHRDLSIGTGAEKYIFDDDYLFGYHSKVDFEKDRFTWDIRERNGYKFEILQGNALSILDPLYQTSFPVVVANKNHGKISDPGAYVKKLADYFIAQNGTFIKATITGLEKENGHIKGVTTDAGILDADQFVFTLGPWSGSLAHKLGLSIPFESERGYHIELINPSHMPSNPIMVASGKFVISPMEGRIRLAGIVEFGGLHAGASKAPLELLKRNAKDILSKITYDRMDEWLGHRPTTANSLPLIGRLNAFPNAFVGFGHQHVGLTAGAKTGRLISSLVMNEKPSIALDAFDPNHYSETT